MNSKDIRNKSVHLKNIETFYNLWLLHQ